MFSEEFHDTDFRHPVWSLIVYIFNVYISAQSIKYWKEIEQKKLQRLDLYSERKGDSFSVSFSAFSYFKKRMCFLIRKQNQH